MGKRSGKKPEIMCVNDTSLCVISLSIIRSLIAVFLDQRTRDKVILCSAKGDEKTPREIFKYVAEINVPVCCGGKNKSAIVDIAETLKSKSSSGNSRDDTELPASPTI